MDRLVTVDAKELELRFNKASCSSSSPRRRCSTSFRVTNLMHTMSVAVHITTTRPSSFSFAPNSLVILPPLSSSSFSLFLLPSDEPPPLVSPRDSVIVRSILLPTGKADPAHLLRLFSKPGVHVFKDAYLPISFVGPDVLQSLLLPSPSSSPYKTVSPKPTDTLETAFLLSKAVSNCSPADLSALLRSTAVNGNPRFVSTLVDAGADVNARDSDGQSPLSLAVAAGSLKTVKLLLDSGSKFDPGVDLFMHEAASKNWVDLMAVLADSDRTAWADVADPAGRTPVHLAVIGGHMEALQFCISSGGGDLDRVDVNGWTPLHFAAVGGSLEMVEFLLEHSAAYTKYVVTGDGRKTPYDLAVDSGNTHLYGAFRLGDVMNRASRSGDATTVESCLVRGAEVDRRDQNGWSPLHRAAFKGRLQAVKVLINQGAQVDAVDDAGYTPLRCAVEAGHADVALCLVANGARVGQKGLRGLVCFALKLDSCTANAAAAAAAPPPPLYAYESKRIEA